MTNDDKTPMERFEELARKTFLPRKQVPRPKEDAEEIMEGGVPPIPAEEAGEEAWEPRERRESDE